MALLNRSKSRFYSFRFVQIRIPDAEENRHSDGPDKGRTDDERGCLRGEAYEKRQEDYKDPISQVKFEKSLGCRYGTGPYLPQADAGIDAENHQSGAQQGINYEQGIQPRDPVKVRAHLTIARNEVIERDHGAKDR